jgi:hypothetical protein
MSPISRRLAWFASVALAAPLLATSGPATSAVAAPVLVVDTVSDLGSLDDCTAAPGDCSLRGAISAANAVPGHDTIHFDIPAGDCPAGVCRITLTVGGFQVTEQVDLDATTQPQLGSADANVCATDTESSHLRVEVVVDAGIDNNVFTIDHATGSTRIRGFALGTNIPDAGSGIYVQSGSGHQIACNHFGIWGPGMVTLASGHFSSGVSIWPAASNVTVGTDGDGVDDAGERNVFGPGTATTVDVIGSIDNVVAGNYFGFNASGTIRLGSGSLSLHDNAQGTRVGTNGDGVSDEVERNYFTGGTNVVVAAASYDDDDVRIAGNTFGMSPLGTQATSDTGIEVSGLAASTTGFEISDNTFGWVETGIELDATAGDVVVAGNTFGGGDGGSPYGSVAAIRAGRSASYVIRDNLIQNSELLGIIVEDDATLAAASRNNCLVGNFFGLTNTTGADISFEGNWWGDVSGPSQAGPGTGDAVSTMVDYDPWLTAPPRQCNTAPSAADASFTVAEDAAAGTVLGAISATDDGADLTYAITAGNWNGAFAIAASTGQVMVAKQLDHETIPAYLLTVTVSDPFLSDTASVAIVVTDVAEPAPVPTFRDVPASHLFFGDVEWLAATGITRGCNPPVNDRFCPDDPVTRGQMAAFLHRALGDVLVPGAVVDFVDDDDSVFEADIEWLGAVGVTRGCNPPVNDRFCPNDVVTREQMAAFLVRALDLPANTGIDFVDDDGSIFEDDIERLATAGVTRGCNPPVNDRFCPIDAVTRAQMAAFLHRALGV